MPYLRKIIELRSLMEMGKRGFSFRWNHGQESKSQHLSVADPRVKGLAKSGRIGYGENSS